MPRRLHHLATVLFFIIVGVLFVLWALTVPVFEAPDEPAHWQYARYLHDRWELPLYRPGFEEANSPPLYYLAIAPFAAESKLPPMVVVNDVRGQMTSLAPPRLFVNSDRDWDWYRPLLIARLWTALLSMVTVWFVYRAAASLMPDAGALAAASLAAFLPQFSFRAVTISNDAGVTLFAAMLTMMCVQLLTRGFTWTRGVIAAAALAGAYLSKISAIALAAPLALTLLEAHAAPADATADTKPDATPDATPNAKHDAKPDARSEAMSASASKSVPLFARLPRLAVLLVALAIVLPWSVRNVMLYGDPTAQSAMRTAVSHLITDRSLFSTYFLWHFPSVTFISFIGLFGWANVFLPTWVYLAFAAFGLIAAAGLVRGWYMRTIDRRVLRMLVLLTASAVAIVVYINLMFTQPQGRYVLPALPGIALLAALGTMHLPAPFGSRLIAAAPVMMLLFNVWCLAAVIVPAYSPPLARAIAPGVRLEHPAAVVDLALDQRPAGAGVEAGTADGTLRFEIAGKDPAVLVPIDIDAAAFDTLEIELTGNVPGITVARGTIRFAADVHRAEDWSTIEFSWRADGTRQTVRVPLSSHAQWRGAIRNLRIDPIDDPPNRGRIELGAIRLRR